MCLMWLMGEFWSSFARRFVDLRPIAGDVAPFGRSKNEFNHFARNWRNQVPDAGSEGGTLVGKLGGGAGIEKV